MQELIGAILLISLVINAVLGLAQLADWLEKRRGAETTAITNVDLQPRVVNMRGDIFNVTVSASDRTVIEPVTDLARTANDHQVPEAHGGDRATSGVCPFEAPSKPEL